MRHIALFSALALMACGGSDKGSETAGTGAAPIPPKAAKAAAVAKDLEANPDDAVTILEKHGLTQAQFEDLMYEIAEDAELSEAFKRARGK